MDHCQHALHVATFIVVSDLNLSETLLAILGNKVIGVPRFNILQSLKKKKTCMGGFTATLTFRKSKVVFYYDNYLPAIPNEGHRARFWVLSFKLKLAKR